MFVQAGVGSLAGAVVGYFTNLYPNNPPKFVVMEAKAADCLYRGAVAGDGAPRIVDGDLTTIMAGLADVYKRQAQAEGEGFLMEVSFYLPNTMDGDDTAEVTAHFSKADMRALLDELDKLCKKFPDRP